LRSPTSLGQIHGSLAYYDAMQAFIPLKSHSERVPGKNFKLLGGKPLYLWIITTLLQIPEINEIVIDTDSDDSDLWKLAEHPRIVIKKRAPNLVGDFVSMNEIILDYLATASENDFLMTHVTNPFLSQGTIIKAIQDYYEQKEKGFDSLFSVSIIQGRLFNQQAKPINHDPSKLLRTQDLETIFLENSCLYLFDKATFLKNNARIGSKPYLLAIPALDAIDIDTREEWDLAQKIASGISTVIRN
jgi:CMP-N-acetylneuraminic acid synthetase